MAHINLYHFLPYYNVNDIEFKDLSNDDNHQYPLSVLNTLTYSCTGIDQHSNNDVDLSEPSLPLINSNYIFSSEETKSYPKHRLKLFFHNISSIPLHFDSLFDQSLNSFDFNFDVFTFCETRLNDNICNLYTLKSYLALVTLFINSMEEILIILNRNKGKCYITGDFNINLMHSNDNVDTYTNLFHSYIYFFSNPKQTEKGHF